MHLEILDKEQALQLELLNQFKKEFVLVGGTAIALHLGHRKSIDFDLFKNGKIDSASLKKKLTKNGIKYKVLFENKDGLHLLIDGVKWTFFTYQLSIYSAALATKHFKLPDLLTLAAMKAYALGRRSKWKDYVDLFSILQKSHTLSEIVKRANDLFEDGFSEKMFRVQLSYFKDIDYSETIDWMVPPVSDNKIKKELIKFSIS